MNIYRVERRRLRADVPGKTYTAWRPYIVTLDNDAGEGLLSSPELHYDLQTEAEEAIHELSEHMAGEFRVVELLVIPGRVVASKP